MDETFIEKWRYLTFNYYSREDKKFRLFNQRIDMYDRISTSHKYMLMSYQGKKGGFLKRSLEGVTIVKVGDGTKYVYQRYS